MLGIKYKWDTLLHLYLLGLNGNLLWTVTLIIISLQYLLARWIYASLITEDLSMSCSRIGRLFQYGSIYFHGRVENKNNNNHSIYLIGALKFQTNIVLLNNSVSGFRCLHSELVFDLTSLWKENIRELEFSVLLDRFSTAGVSVFEYCNGSTNIRSLKV